MLKSILNIQANSADSAQTCEEASAADVSNVFSVSDLGLIGTGAQSTADFISTCYSHFNKSCAFYFHYQPTPSWYLSDMPSTVRLQEFAMRIILISSSKAVILAQKFSLDDDNLGLYSYSSVTSTWSTNR